MRYSAFGLGVSASEPIPRLSGASSDRPVDVRVELRHRPGWFATSRLTRIRYNSPYQDASGKPMLTLGELDNGWLQLGFIDGSDFVIDPAGREVWVVWPEHLTIDDMSSYLLGPVMGFVLRLQGRVCLHASAIAIHGRALALIGAPGAGKSTTAAAFAVNGWPVLSDDVVPLTEDDGGFDASPGYPRLRLWPQAVAALGGLSAAAPGLPVGRGERRYHLDLIESGYEFQTAPLPLWAVYVLEDRTDDPEALAFSPLTGNVALIALVTHSFASSLLDRAMRAHDLATLARLAETVPIRSVRPYADLNRLPALVEAILADFESLPRPTAIAACAE